MNLENSTSIQEVAEIVNKCDFVNVLTLFEAEKHQSDALAIVRSFKFSSDFRVNQIFFNRDISRRGGEFNENIFFGILLGRGKILAPPLDVFNGDLSNLHTIISKLCPPTSNVASVSQGNRPILHVHSSNAMSSRFSYFGENSLASHNLFGILSKLNSQFAAVFLT